MPIDPSPSDFIEPNDQRLPVTPPSNARIKRLLFVVALFVGLLIVAATLFFVFRKNNSTANTNTNSTQTVTMTDATLVSLIETYLSSDSLIFSSEFTAQEDKCITDHTYEGTVVGTDLYLKSQYTFRSGTQQYCDPDIKETYNETYVVEDKIYYKQYADHNFETITADTNVLLGTYPLDFLEQILLPYKDLTISSQTTSGSTVTVTAQGQKDAIDATYTFSIDATANKIDKIAFTFEGENNLVIEGDVVFSVPPNEISAPSAQPDSNLSTYFDSIINYSNVFYSVYAANMYITYSNDFSSKLHVLYKPADTYETIDCPISRPDCQAKLSQLELILNDNVAGMLQTAQSTYCTNEKTPVGNLDEIFADKIQIKISNDNRNPKETADYSIVVDLPLDATEPFSVKLKYSQEYCFDGTTTQGAIDKLQTDLSQFVERL